MRPLLLRWFYGTQLENCLCSINQRLITAVDWTWVNLHLLLLIFWKSCIKFALNSYGNLAAVQGNTKRDFHTKNTRTHLICLNVSYSRPISLHRTRTVDSVPQQEQEESLQQAKHFPYRPVSIVLRKNVKLSFTSPNTIHIEDSRSSTAQKRLTTHISGKSWMKDCQGTVIPLLRQTLTHTDISMAWMRHWGTRFPSKRVKGWTGRHDLNESRSHGPLELTQGNENNSQHKRPIVAPRPPFTFPPKWGSSLTAQKTQW